MDMGIGRSGSVAQATPTISALYEARQQVGAALVLAARDVRPRHRRRRLSALPALVRARRGARAARATADGAPAPGLCGVRHAFTTRNEHVPDESVHVALVDGPFSLLDGMWRFVPLRCPAAERARRAGLQDRIRPALCVRQRGLEAVSARCSTASPTPSSIPSCVAPSRSMARAEASARRDLASTWRAAAARSPSRSTSSCRAGATRVDAVRASGAARALSGAIEVGEPSVGIWGRACPLDATLATATGSSSIGR